jgi:hypothetical protein
MFALGLATGIILMMFLSALNVPYEWRKRHELERRVDKLYRHLACGQGYVGCTGGPRCTSDHK